MRLGLGTSLSDIRRSAALSTYYFSATGLDANDGLSSATPKQTIGAANALGLIGPTNILFKGGDTFSGALVAQIGGIQYGSYGAGRATISSGTSAGLTATSLASVRASSLIFTGGGSTTNATHGISIKNSQAGNTKLAGPTISNCQVSAYGLYGIAIEGAAGSSGFNGVTISGNTVFDCTLNYSGAFGSAGIYVFSVPAYGLAQSTPAHTNVTVSGNTVYDCKGKTGTTNWVGSGIVLSQTDGGAVNGNVAYNNGENNTSSAGNGPVGMWCYDANAITFRFNESYGNKTGNGGDGGGFDIDGGSTNCLMEFNYSHGNAGFGFMFCPYQDSGVTYAHYSNNTMRFNISYQDGLAGINVIAPSGVSGIRCHNNSVYANSTQALLMSGGAPSGTCFVANNIFYAAGTTKLFGGVSVMPIVGNSYYTASSPVWTDGGVDYTTLAAWRAAKGTETLSAAPVGSFGNPGYVGNVTLPAAFKLVSTSALINAGVNLSAAYGVSAGTADYFGNTLGSLPTNVGAYDAAGEAGSPGVPGVVPGSATVTFDGATQGLSSPSVTKSNGNLTVTWATGFPIAVSTKAIVGKKGWLIHADAAAASNFADGVGFVLLTDTYLGEHQAVGLYSDGSTSVNAIGGTGFTFTTGDTIMVIADKTAGLAWFSKDGTTFNNSYTAANVTAGVGGIAFTPSAADIFPGAFVSNSGGATGQMTANFNGVGSPWSLPSGVAWIDS